MLVGHQRQISFAVHHDAVGELQLFRCEGAAQRSQACRIGRIILQGPGHRLLHSSALQHLGHVVQRA